MRGGSPKDEFTGKVVLRATLAGGKGEADPPHFLEIPTDVPDATGSLNLKFKYYQRVEGQFRVPVGSRVVAIAVRAYESGQASPRVTRTLSLG